MSEDGIEYGVLEQLIQFDEWEFVESTVKDFVGGRSRPLGHSPRFLRRNQEGDETLEVGSWDALNAEFTHSGAIEVSCQTHYLSFVLIQCHPVRVVILFFESLIKWFLDMSFEKSDQCLAHNVFSHQGTLRVLDSCFLESFKRLDIYLRSNIEWRWIRSLHLSAPEMLWR